MHVHTHTLTHAQLSPSLSSVRSPTAIQPGSFSKSSDVSAEHDGSHLISVFGRITVSLKPTLATERDSCLKGKKAFQKCGFCIEFLRESHAKNGSISHSLVGVVRNRTEITVLKRERFQFTGVKVPCTMFPVTTLAGQRRFLAEHIQLIAMKVESLWAWSLWVVKKDHSFVYQAAFGIIMSVSLLFPFSSCVAFCCDKSTLIML